MRSFFLSLTFLFLSGMLKAQSSPASADEIMQQAYQVAVKEHKNIILIFHASWCVWCHKMDRSMNDPVCKKFFDENYVTVHMDVDETNDQLDKENPGARDFRKKCLGEGMGIPFWVVFDKSGNILADSKMKKEGEAAEKAENTGCPASEKEVAYFISVLKKTSDLDANELSIIQKRFRMNEQ